MMELLMFPFRLIGSVIGLVFGFVGNLIGAVFGLVGGIFSFVFGGIFVVLGVIGAYVLVRWFVRSVRGC